MAKFGESGDLLKCSFCGKTQKQVRKLIAGGGVYLNGGLLHEVGDLLVRSEFEARFRDKGIMSPYLAEIPVELVSDPASSLIGASLLYRQQVGWAEERGVTGGTVVARATPGIGRPP